MSKINNSANVSNSSQLYLRNQESPVVKTETRVDIEIKTNSDSSYATFCSREGIDRAAFRKAGLGRGLGHIKVGSKTEFEDEHGNKKKGTVLKIVGDYAEVFYEGQVYMVNIKTGKSRGNRKATEAEMTQYQQLQQAQQQEQQRQEQQAEARRDEIKADQRRTDQRKYDIKVNLEKTEQKKLAVKKAENSESKREIRENFIKQISLKAQQIEATESISNRYQISVPKTEHENLTISTALRTRENEEAKKD